MDLRQRMIDALGDDALTIEELADRVGEPASKVDKLIQVSPSFMAIGEQIVYLPALLDGTTWVVPIDADDAASDVAPGGIVRTHPYLAAIGWWLIDSDTRAYDADGNLLAILTTDGIMLDGRDTDVVIGEPGWLDAVAGGWAAVTVHDEELTIAPTDGPPEPTDAQAAAVAAGFEEALANIERTALDGEDRAFRVTSVGSVLHAALLTDRVAFQRDPVPPVDRLVAAAGLEHHDHFVVEPGFDWGAFRAWQRRNQLRFYYGIDDSQVDLVQLLVGACEVFEEQGDDAFGEPSERGVMGVALAAALDDAGVAAAFAGECRSLAVAPEALLAFADALERHARSGGSARTEGVVVVQVRARTLMGDETAAAELLDTNVDISTHHPHLLHMAADLAADRGHAAEARQLIVRSGVTPYDPADDDGRYPWNSGPDHAQLLLAEVEPFARPRTRRDIGRNSPCPCGSGKKYKACHLGKEELPLVDRAPWLYEKCVRYLRVRASDLIDDVAQHITGESSEYYYDLVDSPVVVDLALHDLGIDDAFLEDRGRFLPEDEQLLAAQWALVDRSVFEVEDVRRRPEGGELLLRDVASGDLVVVSQVHVGDQIRPGLVLLGRPLPVGDTYRAFSGFWPLDHSRANAAIDAIAADDPDALLDLLAAGLRPPTVTNTDGQPMEWHRTTWSVDADPDAVGAVLSAAGLRGPEPSSEPGRSRWNLVRDSANQRDTIIATIEVGVGEDGTELVVEVNSEERAEELDVLVEGLFPDAECIDDELIDVDEVRPPGEMPSLDDPALREAVESYILQYEEQWLDDEIPALGGRTPREAVQDPVGREEVLHLLATFPEPDPDAPGMSPTRLRNALGI